jgi:hypothetical protein
VVSLDVLSINIHRKFGLLEIMSFSFYEVEKWGALTGSSAQI